MSAEPLAREVPPQSRQATLERLLALVEAKRKGPRAVAPRAPVAPIATARPQIALVPAPPPALSGDRKARLEALLERVRRAPRRNHG